MTGKTRVKSKPRAKPISLYPLTVDEIASAMLQTPPMPKEQKQPKKPRKKKVKPSNH